VASVQQQPALGEWSDGPRPGWNGSLETCEQSVIKHAVIGGRLDVREIDDAPTVDQFPIELETMQAWGADRTIRAEVLQHLLTESQWTIHTKGIRLRGVRISGPLDLESATLRCPLVLEDCYLDSKEPVVLKYSTVSLLRLVRCRLAGLNADMLVVTKEMDLTRSTFTGAVRLPGANIAGTLNCSGAKITDTDTDNDALVADAVKVGGDVLLDDEFTAAGAIRLHGADITGQLNCSGAKITGVNTDKNALVADEAKVGGDVRLVNEFTAAGAIRLHGADITGQLNCSGAKITGVNTDNNALIADEAKVGGGVLLVDEFTAAGAVRLPGANITGQLNFRGAKITDTDTNNNALVADGVKVSGDVLLDDGFTAAGAIRLIGASVDGNLSLQQATLADPVALEAQGTRIGQQLLWAPKRAVTGSVNLDHVHVNRLDDDWSNDGAYWPVAGKLQLAGFVYGGFGGEHLATCQQRLEWVQSTHQTPSPGLPAPFGAQPYEQLARVYRQMGHESDARRVAIARRNDLRTYGGLGRLRLTGNWLLDITVKHGYQPLRAVGMLLAVFVAAFLLSWGAQHQDGKAQNQDAVMVPAKDTSSLHPPPTALDCRANYPCFYPLGYAMDLTIPIIKVGQAENWRIDGAAAWGWAFVGGTWVITGLGWAFTTLAVVGYTGLIRKD